MGRCCVSLRDWNSRVVPMFITWSDGQGVVVDSHNESIATSLYGIYLTGR